ncbi:alpha/beta hydrolase [Gordonia oryzae]|uniref:Alpha/beta hydrolase n=1 Tax=Gordonia oryzae TaxID=2487349 RepID=A0A3N4G8L2_9ACTN|nr:alpha/beta hydrolase [Gordonia oryzae]RPA59069.1 alpha/beta hydrolase [Gordonia oryzae]
MKLVFLHGVGDGGRDRAWLRALNRRLAQEGLDPIPEDDVIAPYYADMLATSGIRADLPKVTTTKESSDAKARAHFQTRQMTALRSVGRDPNAQVLGWGGVLDAGNPAWVQGAARFAPGEAKHVVGQVNRYVNSKGLRGAIVRKVLGKLPPDGEVVLVGHSLGSVVAIDVISRLPSNIRVKRFITIGSPVSSKIFGQSSGQLIANFPYADVDDWLNMFSPRDPITRGRGLSTAFSDVRDIRVNIGKTAHSADRYFDNSAVARAVSLAFHRARSGDRRTTRVTTALTDETASKLLEMHYCYALEAGLTKGTKARFAEAVRIRREDLVEQIWEANEEGMPLPREFHTLAEGELPHLPDYWSNTQLVEELTVLALSNPISPFEIDVDEGVRAEAVRSVLTALGRDPKIADRIKDAVKEVAGFLRKSGVRWGQVAAVGAGLAIVAIAPLSLAAVAPAGLAGGAALTSSLAAFGPGGMIGGIATVSGITSTGAAVTTAAAVMRRKSPGADVATFVLRVTAAYAQATLGLEYDQELFSALAEARSDISAEINQLSGISDKKAPALAALVEQEEILERLSELLEMKDLVDKSVSGLTYADTKSD